jgi:hypothetical protein
VDEDLVYSFQECVEGATLNQRHDRSGHLLTDRDKITIASLAQHFIDLEKLTFPSFGSLHPIATNPSHHSIDNSTSDSDVTIGPFIRYFPISQAPPYFTGPFKSAKQMYLTYLDIMLEQTRQEKRYAPIHEIEGYLALLDARVLVDECKELDEGLGYIKHGDDKGDHFMVDEEGRLTGVIDWEW